MQIPPTTSSSSSSRTPYNLNDSLFGDTKSALSKENCVQNDGKHLEDKSTSTECIVSGIFQRISGDSRSSNRIQIRERAKDLLSELDEICTNGQRSTANTNTDDSSVSISSEKLITFSLGKRNNPLKIPRLPRLSEALSSMEDDDDNEEDTCTEISSCFSSKSSQSSSKNGAIWEDSLSDGEVLSLGEI